MNGGFIAEFAVLLCVAFLPGRRRLFRGKVFTMWMRRLAARPGMLASGFAIRLLQICAGGLLFQDLLGSGQDWVWFVALYADDYLTGGDDQGKRFKGWARNKVKWLMQLPAPEQQREWEPA